MLRSSLFATVAVSGLFMAATAIAGPGKDFLIHNDDGYGTSDCLAKASACGKIVADAWCESKGFSKAVNYRPAEATDMTASTGATRVSLSDTFVISCTE
jgi:hypothetical protein